MWQAVISEEEAETVSRADNIFTVTITLWYGRHIPVKCVTFDLN